MIDEMGGATSAVVRAALDAIVARHDMIANNIANASTPGFVPKTLRFDDYMAAVKAELSGGDLKGALDALSPRDPIWQRNQTGTTVQLDQEMVALTENVVRYQAILGALDKRGALLKMAIREGRI